MLLVLRIEDNLCISETDSNIDESNKMLEESLKVRNDNGLSADENSDKFSGFEKSDNHLKNMDKMEDLTKILQTSCQISKVERNFLMA